MHDINGDDLCLVQNERSRKSWVRPGNIETKKEIDWQSAIFNHQRMHEGYGSCSVCVCVSVCLSESNTVLAATYLIYKSQVRCYKVSYGISALCGFHWNASFSSFIFSHCLHDEFSLYKMNNRGSEMASFQEELVCRSSNSSYNLTGSSLIIANYQQRFLPFSVLI